MTESQPDETAEAPDQPDEFLVDVDYINQVYAELQKMQVELDVDPVEYGPRRLNEKIALTRSMLSRCEQVFLQVSHKLQLFKREFRLKDTLLKLAVNKLISSDPRVQIGRSARDRDAIAKTLLEDEVSYLNKIESGISEFEQAIIVVKSKRSDLKDTAGRLRDQIRLCRDEIEFLQRSWGSKLPGVPIGAGVAVSQPTDLESLLGEVTAEIDASREDGTWEDPPEFDPFPEPEPEAVLSGISDDDDDDDDIAGSILALMTKPKPTPEPEPEPESKPTLSPNMVEEQDVLKATEDPDEILAYLDGDDDDDEADIMGVADDDDEDLEALFQNFDI
jgi:hypothetical protein